MNGITGFIFLWERVVAIPYPEIAYALKQRDHLSSALVTWRLRRLAADCQLFGKEQRVRTRPENT
jgi:hypothetical protein